MPKVVSNGIEIHYEESGPTDGPAVLLIMGLAVQLTGWPQTLIDRLNKAGYRTIRFDNRDIGLSGRLEQTRAPNVLLQAVLSRLHITGLAPYQLTDMAHDTIGLADALELQHFHLVGVSMGGMIGQIVAATWPKRIASFTAIMTSTNNRKLPGPRREVVKALVAPRKPDETPEDAVERSVAMWNLIGTQEDGDPQDDLRQRVAAAYQRCHYPQGIRRQLSAIIETGDLRRWTRKITAPTLVMHGTADPLVRTAGGEDVAANIAGARFHPIEGLGHDLPERFLPGIADAMIDHFGAAEVKITASRVA